MTDTPAHTPGPWVYRQLNAYRGSGVDPYEANARLIATAPVLVEALREIQTLCITESHKFMGGSGQKIAEIHVTVNEALAALPAGWKGE